MIQIDYSQPYVTRDEYLEVKGIDLNIELQDDDNRSNKVNRFIQDLTNFVLDHLVMEYNCNELNRQMYDFEDLAEFRRVRFHYGMLDQIEYVLNNGLIHLDSGINRETGSIIDFSAVVIGPGALRQFKLGGFCNKQERSVPKGDLSPRDMPSIEELLMAVNGKVDKVEGKGLSTNDFSAGYKGLVDELNREIDNKVDKAVGKVLSSNDFTDALKLKLQNLDENAEANVIEQICLDNEPLSVQNKSVNIPLDDIASEPVRRAQRELYFKEDRRSKVQVINEMEPYDTTYPSEIAVINFVNGKLLDAQSYTDNALSRSNLVSILGEASQQLNGLMSATDKTRLDTLFALLGSEEDADIVVDTISEVLEVFNLYPEGVNLAIALAGKQAKLTSGTNIKTINGESVLGSGDITIDVAPEFATNSEIDALFE